MSEWRRVGEVSDFPEGRPRSVRLGDRRVAIFRVGTEWFALEDVCAHMRARLSEGSVDGLEVTCSWHGWRYDLRTGRSLTKSWARVRTCPVKVEGGEVWLGPLCAEEPPPGGAGGESPPGP